MMNVNTGDFAIVINPGSSNNGAIVTVVTFRTDISSKLQGTFWECSSPRGLIGKNIETGEFSRTRSIAIRDAHLRRISPPLSEMIPEPKARVLKVPHKLNK